MLQFIKRFNKFCRGRNVTDETSREHDLWKIKPLDSELIARNLSGYDYVVTLEEQTLSGGFGSAVCEALADENVKKPILRIGLPERYIFENGSRDYHLDNNGLSVDDIHSKIKDFIS